MKTLSSEMLQTITMRLVNEFQPERIILFGSYAWGKPTEDSDLDIMVIVPDSNLPPVQRSIKAHRCLRGIHIPKDVLVKTSFEFEKLSYVHASLEAQVKEQGKIIYER